MKASTFGVPGPHVGGVTRGTARSGVTWNETLRTRDGAPLELRRANRTFEVRFGKDSFEERLQSGGGWPWVTLGLIGANVAVFVAASQAGANVLLPAATRTSVHFPPKATEPFVQSSAGQCM